MKKLILAILILMFTTSSITINAVPKEFNTGTASVYYFVVYHLYYLSKPKGGDAARYSKKYWFVSYYDQLDNNCLSKNGTVIKDNLKSQLAAEFGYVLEDSYWILETDPELSVETATTEKEIELKRRNKITELRKPDAEVEAYYEARGSKNPNVKKVIEFKYDALFECQ